MNNTTHEPFATATNVIDKYVTIFVLIIGVPGNLLSFVIWMQKRMRHSSGYYLAALAVNDLIFLLMAMMFEIHVVWLTVNVLSYPLICQLFPVIYLALQALSPCLVLAFTTERYISICHPFKRDKFCTIRRAKFVVACLTVGCLILSAIYGYFFDLTTASDGSSVCDGRTSVTEGGRFSVYNVYEIARSTLSFLLVPLAILVLNALVIREMSRLSRFEPTQNQGASNPRTGSTTIMLLSVSFYQIITTLPISVVYAMYFDFQTSPTFNLVFVIIKEYGITHYAFNFIIYVVTGRMFREELKRLFLRPFGKVTSHFSSEYNSLQTSVHSTVKRKWSSANGNSNSGNDKCPEPNETLL